MRKVILFGSVSAVALGMALTATPASAAAGDTLVTFTAGVTGSTVSISPGVYVPGAGSTNTVTGSMVSVVTDLRTTSGSWTDTVSSTAFNLVGATSPAGTTAQIPASSAKIWTPTAVVTVPGTATINNTHVDLASALTLSGTAANLLSATTANVNISTLTSDLQIDTTGKAAGVYTGTITQTVS